jgi:formiminoglutamase
MQNFEPVSRTLFFKSPRKNDSRLGEYVIAAQESALSAATSGFVLLGYPDDEGIRRNHGRLGAKDAPDAIRSAFYKLTPGRENFPAVYDIGNLEVSGSLEDRQKKAKQSVAAIFKNGHRLLALGGGNDYAYPDVAGFLENQSSKQKALVINIDAHFDLRSDENGPTSGTPFYQLLKEYDNFELVEIGIQPFGNSMQFFDFAKKNKVKVFNFEKTYGKLLAVLKSLRAMKRPVFLCIDVDAFSSAYAPGASAASPIGLDPHELISAMPWVAQNMNIRGVGVYEVSPTLDRDNQTSKLAAQIVHSFLLNVKK